MHKKKIIPEKWAAKVIKQTLLPLSYMHAKNIMHRDVKLENLLVLPQKDDSGELQVKLTDFGFATHFEHMEQFKLQLGSGLYMSPELMENKYYDNRVDTWAVGCLTYILLTGTPPFGGRTDKQRKDAICANNPSYHNMTGVSCEAKDFIRKCLVTDIKKRPQIAEMLEHSWIKNIEGIDLTNKVKIDIGNNLLTFKKADAFQCGVMQMIVNLKSTSDELEELNVMFEKFDSNHDGVISMDELKVGMKEIMDPWNYDNADWQSYFDAIDVDKDGKLSYAEFTTAAFSRARMLTDKNIDAVFNVFDTNKDGHIGV